MNPKVWTKTLGFTSKQRSGSLFQNAKHHPLLRTGTLTVIHHHHTPEYHQRCQHLLPSQGIHTDADTDHDGDDGLHIRVHANQRRTDALLPQWDEEIGDEGGAHDEERQFREISSREAARVKLHQFAVSPSPREGSGKKENPLHEGDDRILLDNRLEQPQIEREGQPVQHHEQDTLQVSLCGSSAARHTVQYQVDDAQEADEHTARFAPRDRLLQGIGGNEHGVDGRQRTHDGAVHRRDVRYRHQKGDLRDEEAQQRSHQNLAHVLLLDLLFRQEARNEPEERTRT